MLQSPVHRSLPWGSVIRLVAGVAALLLAAGCGVSERPAARAGAENATPVEAADTGAVAGQEPVVRPGDASQVLAEARAPGAAATVVNIWATWCPPCRQEFPDLVRFDRDHRDQGVRVVFVSTDFEDQIPMVRRFLARQGVDRPSWIKTGDDMAFIDGIHAQWTGALPATFIFDREGRLRTFWEGAADYRKFEHEVRKVLNENPRS